MTDYKMGKAVLLIVYTTLFVCKQIFWKYSPKFEFEQKSAWKLKGGKTTGCCMFMIVFAVQKRTYCPPIFPDK